MTDELGCSQVSTASVLSSEVNLMSIDTVCIGFNDGVATFKITNAEFGNDVSVYLNGELYLFLSSAPLHSTIELNDLFANETYTITVEFVNCVDEISITVPVIDIELIELEYIESLEMCIYERRCDNHIIDTISESYRSNFDDTDDRPCRVGRYCTKFVEWHKFPKVVMKVGAYRFLLNTLISMGGEPYDIDDLLNELERLNRWSSGDCTNVKVCYATMTYIGSWRGPGDSSPGIPAWSFDGECWQLNCVWPVSDGEFCQDQLIQFVEGVTGISYDNVDITCPPVSMNVGQLFRFMMAGEISPSDFPDFYENGLAEWIEERGYLDEANCANVIFCGDTYEFISSDCDNVQCGVRINDPENNAEEIYTCTVYTDPITGLKYVYCIGETGLSKHYLTDIACPFCIQEDVPQQLSGCQSGVDFIGFNEVIYNGISEPTAILQKNQDLYSLHQPGTGLYHSLESEKVSIFYSDWDNNIEMAIEELQDDGEFKIIVSIDELDNVIKLSGVEILDYSFNSTGCYVIVEPDNEGAIGNYTLNANMHYFIEVNQSQFSILELSPADYKLLPAADGIQLLVKSPNSSIQIGSSSIAMASGGNEAIINPLDTDYKSLVGNTSHTILDYLSNSGGVNNIILTKGSRNFVLNGNTYKPRRTVRGLVLSADTRVRKAMKIFGSGQLVDGGLVESSNSQAKTIFYLNYTGYLTVGNNSISSTGNSTSTVILSIDWATRNVEILYNMNRSFEDRIDDVFLSNDRLYFHLSSTLSQGETLGIGDLSFTNTSDCTDKKILSFISLDQPTRSANVESKKDTVFEILSLDPIDVEDTGTTNSESEDIVIYPNPSRGIFDIKVGSVVIQELSIWSSNGKCVTKINEEISSTYRVDFSHLPSGIYLVRLKTHDNIYFRKVVIANGY